MGHGEVGRGHSGRLQELCSVVKLGILFPRAAFGRCYIVFYIFFFFF